MIVELNIGKDIPRNKLTDSIIKIELLRYFRLNLNEEVRRQWDRYLRDNLDPSINCDSVMEGLISNMRTTTVDGKYLVFIDDKRFLKNTNYRLVSVIKLFNYGNLSIKGSHLISNAFDYLKNNISKILVLKYFGVMM